MGLKIHMSNLFDRNPIFKEAVKLKVEEFINIMKEFAIEHTINYIVTIRTQD